MTMAGCSDCRRRDRGQDSSRWGRAGCDRCCRCKIPGSDFSRQAALLASITAAPQLPHRRTSREGSRRSNQSQFKLFVAAPEATIDHSCLWRVTAEARSAPTRLPAPASAPAPWPWPAGRSGAGESGPIQQERRPKAPVRSRFREVFPGSHAANLVQGARVGWMLHQAGGDLLLASLSYTLRASLVNLALPFTGNFTPKPLMFP